MNLSIYLLMELNQKCYRKLKRANLSSDLLFEIENINFTRGIKILTVNDMR